MNDFPGLIQSLQLALKATVMYTTSHPRTQGALAGLSSQLDLWLETAPALHIAASQGKLFLDGAPFEGGSVHLTALARQLNERQVNGFVIRRGVTPEELQVLIEVLILKPAKVEAAGGVLAIFEKKQLRYIQASQTQYREVREGTGEDGDQGAPGSRIPSEAETQAALALIAAAAQAEETLAGEGQTAEGNASQGQDGPEDQPPSEDASTRADLERALRLWEQAWSQLPILPPQASGEGPTPADLAFLRDAPLELDPFEPSSPQLEALRRSLLALPPETQLSILSGFESLPSTPLGLRVAFQSVAATLEAGLREGGADAALLQAFRGCLQQMEWDQHSTDEKVSLASQPGQLWNLSLDQRLTFLRQLLLEGRTEDFLALLDLVLERLREEEPAPREAAARTLAGVPRWMAESGFPLEAEMPIMQGLNAHFGWEPHFHIHRLTAEALDTALASLVQRGEPGHALGWLKDLVGLCQFQDSATEWREAALQSLWARLADPTSLSRVIELLHTATPETLLNELIPYLESAGDASCDRLVEALGSEPDRKRRGRLIEVLRGMGDCALPSLYRGLNSPAWFLVRNTLVLLADIGDASVLPLVVPCLTHADGRVQRAAVRTLWKVCGPVAVPHLLGALPEADAATRMEIIFALGQLQAPEAVPAISACALDRRAPEPLRIRAAETLGQIGVPEALPTLVELGHRKGRFFTSAEPTAIRLAACRALLSYHSPEALEALNALVEAEPWNKERALLQQVLDQN